MVRGVPSVKQARKRTKEQQQSDSGRYFPFYNGAADTIMVDRGFIQGVERMYDRPATSAFYYTSPRFAAVAMGHGNKRGHGFMYTPYDQNSGVTNMQRSGTGVKN